MDAAVSDNAPEIETLLQQAQTGDVSSVALLMQQHRNRLKQMVRARMDPRLGTRVDPSDVIQDALTTAYQQLPKYLEQQTIPFYPWLRRIAWQKLVHVHEVHLDAAKRSVKHERQGYWGISDHSASRFANQFPAHLSTPSAAAVREENQLQIRQALASLSERDREVLVQRYIEQLTIKEIAAVMDLSEGAVHMRHMRALEKMHCLLSGDDV